MERGSKTSERKRKRFDHREPGRLREVMIIAEHEGLLRGGPTQVVRGRMPRALVARAKSRTGIASDTDLIKVALAYIAVADDYPDWLLSQRGTVAPEIDLEFNFRNGGIAR